MPDRIVTLAENIILATVNILTREPNDFEAGRQIRSLFARNLNGQAPDEARDQTRQGQAHAVRQAG